MTAIDVSTVASIPTNMLSGPIQARTPITDAMKHIAAKEPFPPLGIVGLARSVSNSYGARCVDVHLFPWLTMTRGTDGLPCLPATGRLYASPAGLSGVASCHSMLAAIDGMQLLNASPDPQYS